jgi:hypothetical protein
VNINISSEDILYLVCDTFALCCSPTKQDNVMTVSNGQLGDVAVWLYLVSLGLKGGSRCDGI